MVLIKSLVEVVLLMNQLINLRVTFTKNVLENLIYLSCKYNIWGTDLADIQLLSKHNKRIKYLLRVIDIFNKYAWVVPLKDKKRN